MQLELPLTAARGPRLLIAASAGAGWEEGIAPWFAAVAQDAWQVERPSLVVVPTRGHVTALKERLLATGQSTLGVQFLTPPYLRAALSAAVARDLPRREHLSLLLAIAAEQQLSTPDELSEAERLAAISVRRTPGHLLGLLEQLGTAGWEFDALELSAFRPVVRRFREHLAACDFHLSPDADRDALARARQATPLFANLLVTGFSGAHWPLWHLLQAAVHTATRATVILHDLREPTSDLDAAWIGSWEEKFSEAAIVGGSEPGHHFESEPLFVAGMDTREQAQAITALVQRFLAGENGTRIGVVFPAAGALSRLVAADLKRDRIPHFDAMGQTAPGILEAAEFRAWLELQRTPRLHALLRFLRTLPSSHALFAEISRDQIGRALEKLLGEIALDDLVLLAAACRNDAGESSALSRLIEAIRFLPERGTVAEFLRATGGAFAELQWQEQWRELSAVTAPALEVPFARTLYLKWLASVASTVRITRDVAGQHPYARVQLLTASQAEAQSWSHLILAGLNEGVWPGSARGDFLPASAIDSFNQGVRKMNRAATRRGRQGEGHIAVREGKALFLGSAQQRQIALAQFEALCESARHGLALTASLIQEAAPERISNPSQLFSGLYHRVHGVPLSQQTMRALRDATHVWLQTAELTSPAELAQTPDIAQTGVAYRARRREAESDEYDFALRTPPNEIKPLSVSEVEAMLKTPALVWLRHFLGVAPHEDSTYAWNATIGKWTHEWLAAIGQRDGFAPFPEKGDIAERVSAAARRKRAEVEQLCNACGKLLPDWWSSGWEYARAAALTLGQVLATADDWPWLAPEWKLTAQPVDVGESRTLVLRGRADLLLAKGATPPASLRVPELWIVDFKTGNKKPLTVRTDEAAERHERVRKQVLKRDGLQLALYALAARQHGAGDIHVSLISPVQSRAEPQLSIDDYAGCAKAFQELARMQATGIFGMRGALRSAFTFTPPYPIATLPIDKDLLEERWESTHEDLAREEEAWW